MIKRHKHKIQNSMKRTSRIYLNDLNSEKSQQLYEFLCQYRNIVAYFVEYFWSTKQLDENLPDKTVTDKAVARFGITARLAQCASKQAKELVRSQIDNKLKTIPKVKTKTATLDSRFVLIEDFRKKHFELCLRLGSGVPKLTIPFNKTSHFNKYFDNGWSLAGTVRLGCDKKKRIWVEFIFKKERPIKKTCGKILGIDRGVKKSVVTSDGQIIGENLLKGIEKQKLYKRRTFRTWLKTELNRELKSLCLDDVKIVVLENLRKIKHGKKGTLPRRVNRLFSFWFPTRVESCCRKSYKFLLILAFITSFFQKIMKEYLSVPSVRREFTLVETRVQDNLYYFQLVNEARI